MAKRIYFESIAKWWKEISAGASISLIGGLFAYLVFTGAITVHDFSGDSYCAGTLEDPCYAYINFTANEDIFIYPVGYDPYGRNTIMEFEPALKDWKLQRSWGSGWRNIPLDKSCTGTWCGLSNAGDERKFSMAFREGKTYQVRIVAYKHNVTDVIKWGAFDGLVDPIWYGPDYIQYFDSNVDIRVSPIQVMDYTPVYFNVTLKKFTGDINVLLGFNFSDTKPLLAEYYNSNTYSNGTVKGWLPVNSFQSINCNPGNTNCFYVANVPFVVNVTRYLRVKFRVFGEGDYDFAVYPSSYGTNVQSAIANGHFYKVSPDFESHVQYVKNYVKNYDVNLKSVIPSSESILENNKEVIGHKNKWGVVCYEN